MPPKFTNAGKLSVIRSDLTDYFEIVSGNHVRCKLASQDKCDRDESKPFVYDRNRGWTNFERHLELVHKIEKQKKKETTKLDLTAHFFTKINPRQKYPTDCLYNRMDVKQQRFETDVLDFITIDGVPLDIVTKPGFTKLIKNIDRQLRIPARRTIGRRLKKELRKIRSEHRKLIQELQGESVTVTLDLWSSAQNASVLGIKIHFVDKMWNLRTMTVGFRHFDHKKTGHNLRLYVKNFLAKNLKLEPSKIVAFMADNAPENVKAFNLEEFINDSSTTYDGEVEENRSIDADVNEEPNQEEQQSKDDGDTEEGDYVDEVLILETDKPDDFTQNEEFVDDALNLESIDWSASSFVRLGCIAHGIQLVIKDTIISTPVAKKMVERVMAIITFFNNSNYWNSKLVAKAKLTVITPGATRWNGIIFAIERLLQENFINQINEVLIEAANQPNSSRCKVPACISPSFTEGMKDLLDLLKPFVEVTDRLQAENTATSSLVLHGIIGLYKRISKVQLINREMEPLKQNVLLLIVERFAAGEQFSYKGRGPRKQLLRCFDKTLYVLAAILDPRVKMKPFLAKEKLTSGHNLGKYIKSETEVREMLKLEMEKVLSSVINDSASANQGSELRKKKQKRDSIFDDDSDDEMSAESSITKEQLSIDQEIQLYLSEKCIDMDCDPFLYWRMKGSALPHFKALAQKYLAVPASSGSVERLFSIAGCISRARRARLTVENLEDMLLY